MKILVLHQYYLFPGQPGGSRFNEMARLWSEAGHDVTVIAGTLNYSTGERQPGFARRWCVRTREEHAEVWRCYVPATYNASFFGRLLAFFGFMLSSSWAALRVRRPDVVIASSPPLTLAIPAWIAARLRRGPLPWVFEVRDLWPESAVTTGVLARNGYFTKLLYALERWAYESADALNVLTPAFRQDIVGRRLAQASKVWLVPNGADSAFLGSVRRQGMRHEFNWGTRVVALYAGVHGRANALDQLLDAAEHLRDRRDILIATVGDGPERERLIAERTRRGLSNIEFHGPYPKERMPEILAGADIGIAVLQNNETFRTVYPNKVFDYMACGRPVVLAIDGVARDLVCNSAIAGVFAEPENGAALAAAIVQLADSPILRDELGRNGRSWVAQNATREALASRYLTHLETLLAERRPLRTAAAETRG